MKFPYGIYEKTVAGNHNQLHAVTYAINGFIFLAITLPDIVTENCKTMRHLGTA